MWNICRTTLSGGNFSGKLNPSALSLMLRGSTVRKQRSGGTATSHISTTEGSMRLTLCSNWRRRTARSSRDRKGLLWFLSTLSNPARISSKTGLLIDIFELGDKILLRSLTTMNENHVYCNYGETSRKIMNTCSVDRFEGSAFGHPSHRNFLCHEAQPAKEEKIRSCRHPTRLFLSVIHRSWNFLSWNFDSTVLSIKIKQYLSM